MSPFSLSPRRRPFTVLFLLPEATTCRRLLLPPSTHHPYMVVALLCRSADEAREQLRPSLPARMLFSASQTRVEAVFYGTEIAPSAANEFCVSNAVGLCENDVPSVLADLTDYPHSSTTTKNASALTDDAVRRYVASHWTRDSQPPTFKKWSLSSVTH